MGFFHVSVYFYRHLIHLFLILSYFTTSFPNDSLLLPHLILYYFPA